MNIPPIQQNPAQVLHPNTFVYQNENHPNNRLERSQESGEIRGRCQTCLNRRYRDVSDDPGVSFQAPTRLTPGQAATAVHAHEREHYMREEHNARMEGREVIHNSIRIFTDICPECGIQYVSGGETRTTTRGPVDGAEDGNVNNDAAPQDEVSRGGMDISI